MADEQIPTPLYDYLLDACQRSVLFLDVLRQRGNTYRERTQEAAPNVLSFDVEVIRDGRSLPRPVNYLLVRVQPPDGVTTDPAKRPFVVVDPRAGHGPGIGGMKKDSEIGMALVAGHPCYFIGFLPEPVPEQTIEDVWNAEAVFIEDVTARHPGAETKPAVIANCQAGWQTMIMAATHPEVAGPLLLAGSPLSYWDGVRGVNPMRYTGGLLGGTWMTSLAGDIGHGTFDGANLVANFEKLDPANTLWQKPYNLYSKVDTETERFLDFETWWGSPVLLNAGEMQWIADNLFVGNKLATGKLKTSDGVRIDLRNVSSTIIIFCSWGDNITPPQQALGWITDLYEHERDIVANGQTLVYCLHQTIGHLGIFVSGKVASKEHGEFTNCMDMIDLMPPGLYEAVIADIDEDTANPSLIEGRYLFSLHARTLADIRALGGNSPEDDKLFETAARVSEINRTLYERFAAPIVRAWSTAAGAEAMRRMHPNRMRFAAFSDENPMMRMIASMADGVRNARRPASPDNPFAIFERTMSNWIASSIALLGKGRDAAVENIFLQTYAAPVLQAVVGIAENPEPQSARIERDQLRETEQSVERARLEKEFEAGGTPEAIVRALAYIRGDDGSVDERGFATLKALRETQPAARRRSMNALKQLLKEQTLLVRLDEERALAAIPKLLPRSQDERNTVLDRMRRVVAARGALTEEEKRRLARIEALFASERRKPIRKETTDA